MRPRSTLSDFNGQVPEAFAQQSVDAARTQQQGVAATNASPPTNTPPPTRTGDGQVVNSNPTAGGGEGSGGAKK